MPLRFKDRYIVLILCPFFLTDIFICDIYVSSVSCLIKTIHLIWNILEPIVAHYYKKFAHTWTARL